MAMRSRAAKKRAHVVELNEPVLKNENEIIQIWQNKAALRIIDSAITDI